MNSFGIPRAFRKSKRSQSRSKVPQLTIDVKGSKVQHILGLSSKELNTARSQSVSSSSTARPPDSSISDATTASVTSALHLDKTRDPGSARDTSSKASSVLLKDEFDHESTKTPVTCSVLSSYPSTSTLRSHYDRSKTPLSISQQTSNSSSRDFALRKGTRPVIPRTSQEMEHAVQMLFIKSSKPRPKESKNLSKIDTQHIEDTVATPLGGGDGRYYSRGDSHYTTPQGGGKPRYYAQEHYPTPSAVALPISPPPTTPGRKFFSTIRRTESQQVRPPTVTGFSVHDPYAKVNVRRPKAGAKNWFDDAGDGLSEDEVNEEPIASANFVTQVEQAFAESKTTTESAQNSVSAISSFLPSVPSIKTPKTAVPYRVIIPPGSARALLTEHNSLPHKASFPEKKPVHTEHTPTRKLRKRPSILAAADLTKQSVLCLSSSDDEEDAETFEPVDITKSKAKIRESLTEDNVNDLEVEIGLAKTVKANSGEPIVRALHPRTEALRSTHPKPPPLNVPARASSRHASYLLDASTENDMSENDIITSFPATPSDTASFRTSIRSSIFSDNGSLASTRPMLVTKQEEKLLAAMRMKKAAMRQAERDTDRDGALRVLESGGRNSAMSTRRGRSHVSEQERLDHRLSNRYIPSQSHAHHCSFSEDEQGLSPDHARESGTTFETSVYSQRNSQATVRTIFSDDSDSPYSAYPRSDATVMSPTRPQPQRHPTLGRHSNRRDMHHSSTSTISSNRRDSHVVMLDGLDEALSREHVPSQLFMEAPFIGWERAGLTTAH